MLVSCLTEISQEAVACVREELMLVKKHHVFVEAAIMLTLEQKLANNTKLGDLFSVLFTEDLMNADAFLQGCQAPFEIAEEVSIDVPGNRVRRITGVATF